jgi:hypothetical protein
MPIATGGRRLGSDHDNLAYRIGKRNRENTDAFVADLGERVISNPQISSDAWHGYEPELLA